MLQGEFWAFALHSISKHFGEKEYIKLWATDSHYTQLETQEQTGHVHLEKSESLTFCASLGNFCGYLLRSPYNTV